MIKILIGGSPCTFWSIAQKNNRETEAEGLGWELFKNYLIAKEKFKPDFFLYENNKSAAQAIKDQISRELDVELMYIDSALVSAQRRQRFYAFNWTVEQPEDRGILLKDVLETAECAKFKPLSEKEMEYMVRETRDGRNHFDFEHHHDATKDKSACVTANTHKGVPYNVLCEPVRVGQLANGSQGDRVYSIDGKSVGIKANGGGWGAKTGLYAIPVENLVVREATKKGFTEIEPGDCVDMTQPNSKTRRGRNMKDKSNCLMTGNQYYQYIGTVDKPIYEVRDGMIEIKGKKYPIKLVDGYYIIRKLTPVECERLQTMPDGYTACVSDTQRYKGLGNGWTAEVIIHILQGALKDVPKDEEIVVLSMYDGIGTGRYCLDKMGFTNVKYFAYEIDKYAKQIAMSNYPDIIQMGDAFQLREPDWTIGY